jgi:hypothetical protein
LANKTESEGKAMKIDDNGTVKYKLVFEGNHIEGYMAWFEFRPDVKAYGYCPSKAVDNLLAIVHEIHLAKQKYEAISQH